MANVNYIKNLDSFNLLVAKTATSTKSMIVGFTAAWCPQSQRVGPIFAAMSQEAENAGWIFRIVDVEVAADVSRQAHIRCIPTFKVYKGGVEVGMLQGASEKQGIRGLL